MKWSIINYETHISRVKTIIKGAVKRALGNCNWCKPINADDNFGVIDAILFSAYSHGRQDGAVYYIYDSGVYHRGGIHRDSVWNSADVFWICKGQGDIHWNDVF